MHAGHWVLRVVQADLPARHRLEPERVELELVPGEVREVALRAIPAQSEVRFVDEAELTPKVEPAPPTPRPEPVPATRRTGLSSRRVVLPPAAEPVPPPTRRAEAAPVRHWYTVGRGDARLSVVARVMYGDVRLWPKIWLANRDLLRTPDDVRAGMRLRIPDKAPLTAEEIAARDAWGGRRR